MSGGLTNRFSTEDSKKIFQASRSNPGIDVKIMGRKYRLIPCFSTGISPDFNQKSIIQISQTTSPKSPRRIPGENVTVSSEKKKNDDKNGGLQNLRSVHLRDIVGIEFGRLPQVPAARVKGPVVQRNEQ